MKLLDWLHSLKSRFGFTKSNRKRATTRRRQSQHAAQIETLEPRAMLAAATIDLSSLLPANGGDGSTGVTIFGAQENDQTGKSVTNLGDINGDGFDDVLIGATNVNRPNGTSVGRPYAGAAYVVFGKGSWSATVDLETLDGSNGFRLLGIDTFDYTGWAVSSAGDVNGDGFNDMLISAPNADGPSNQRNYAGDHYLVFGKASWNATLDLVTLDGSNGVTIQGADVGDTSPKAVGRAGDVNGDGFDDLIISTFHGDGEANDRVDTGEVYIVFGKASWTSTLDLRSLDGTNGTTLFGIEAGDNAGYSARSGGDINGDGFDDLIIGAIHGFGENNATQYAGETYVVFGKANWTASSNLAELDGSNGFTIFGIDEFDQIGLAVDIAGDVNGDGFDDLIISTPLGKGPSNGGSAIGETYVVFGKASCDATLNLSSLDGNNGFTIFGIDNLDRIGNSISGAGDVNGDGFDDLIIGAPYTAGPNNSRSNGGESYVVFGRATWNSQLLLGTLDASSGFTVFGSQASGYSGFSVSSAGDVNGDGFADLIIGAPRATPSNNGHLYAGEAYIIFGGNFTNSVTDPGTTGDDTQAGIGDPDYIVGGLGNDTILGNGGADVLYGGNGNDVLKIADNSFRRVAGGNGNDTLVLDGSAIALDLTTMPRNRLSGIEVIDVRGNGSNWIILDAAAVLRLTQNSNPQHTSNKLTVLADGNDIVDIGTGWTSEGVQRINGQLFKIYTQGNATLQISTTLDLGLLLPENGGDGSLGVTVFGSERDIYFGATVGNLGDINGDGFDDVIVGAPYAPGANASSLGGQVYVIFGRATWPATIDSGTLDGTSGFKIFGIDAFDSAGVNVSGVGDVNGDGFNDFLIGAQQGDGPSNGRYNAGESYLVFGKATWGASLELSTLDGTNGVTLFGIDPTDYSGSRVGRAGDVNGDGFDDLLIGDRNADGAANDKSNSGEVYVVFGKATWTATLDLGTLNGTNGSVLYGIDIGDEAGSWVSTAGDLNGDGFDDLIIGAARSSGIENGTTLAGETYVVFGKQTWDATLQLSSLNGTNGFTIFGIDPIDFSGANVRAAGDVNGDGFDDLIIGARYGDGQGGSSSQMGESYVVFGKATFSATLNLSELDGSNGFIIYGASQGDWSGTAVSGAGDVNGDGFDDLLIGAHYADSLGDTRHWAGQAYVVYGKATWSGWIHLSQLDSTTGFVLEGVDPFDNAGWSVSAPGDVNGDGFDDVIVGAVRGAPAYSNAHGEVYIVFGGNFTNSVTQVGDDDDNTLIGDAEVNRLVGGRGSDTLTATGTGDVLYGGQGDDVLVVSNSSYRRVAGGNGTDTLRILTRGLNVDFVTFAKKLSGIEILDFRSSGGDNYFAVSKHDVLSITQASNGAHTSNTLRIRLGQTDGIGLLGNWTYAGVETLEGVTYDVYKDGQAKLMMEFFETTPPASTLPELIGSATLPGSGTAWDFQDGPLAASAIFADINADGKDELIVVAGNKTIVAYTYSTTGEPLQVLRTFSQSGTPSEIHSTPIVTNIPGIGVVIFAGTFDGRVFGWNAATGAILPGWPATVDLVNGSQPLSDLRNSILGGIASGDLDGDGTPEILVPSINHELTAFRANGSVYWRYNNDDTIIGTPVIGDIDNDGLMDVVFGGDSSQGAIYNQGGRVTALSGDGKRKWVTQIDQVAQSSAALADLDKDGYLDVVIGTGYNFPNVGNKVYAFDRFGNLLPGWPYTTNANAAVKAGTFPSPAIADLDGDGNLDVIIGDGQGKIHVIKSNGTTLWVKDAFDPQLLYSSPIVADVNGDGTPDVIIAAGNTVRAFSGSDGEQIWDYTDETNTERFYTSPSVGHFKGDAATWQLAFAGLGTQSNVLKGPSTVHMYDLAETEVIPPWSTFRRDATGGNAVVRSDEQLESYVIKTYQTLLNRTPSQGEIDPWVNYLRNGATVNTFVDAIFSSVEYRNRIINGWYVVYLGRPADDAGYAYWQNFLATGNSVQSGQALILSSNEAFQKAGSNVQQWVTYLYQQVLGRTPSNADRDSWAAKITSNQQTRTQVATSFLLSVEFTQNQVRAFYMTANPNGITTPAADSLFAAAWDIRRGKSLFGVFRDIINTDGDYVLVNQEGMFVRQLYKDLLNRSASAADVAAKLTLISSGTPLTTIAASLVQSTEYRTLLVQSYYQRFLNRSGSASDVAGWVNNLNSGMSRENVIKAFVQSAEFMNRAGNTATGFINLAYQTIMKRAATDGDRSYWQSQPNLVATLTNTLLHTEEYFRGMIDDYYFTYLRRFPNTLPDSGALYNAGTYGAQTQVTALVGGGNPETVEINLLASAEYAKLVLTKAVWSGTRWKR